VLAAVASVRRGLACFAIAGEVRLDLLDRGFALRVDLAFALGVGDGGQERRDLRRGESRRLRLISGSEAMIDEAGAP